MNLKSLFRYMWVVLILRKWQLIAYIESFKWSDIATRLINTKFVRRIKKVFLESEANLKTFKKFLVHNGVSYKFVFKSVKSLTRIFWMIEYWWKAQKQENLVDKCKTIFLGKWGNIWNFFHMSQFPINLF